MPTRELLLQLLPFNALIVTVQNLNLFAKTQIYVIHLQLVQVQFLTMHQVVSKSKSMELISVHFSESLPTVMIMFRLPQTEQKYLVLAKHVKLDLCLPFQLQTRTFAFQPLLLFKTALNIPLPPLLTSVQSVTPACLTTQSTKPAPKTLLNSFPTAKLPV